MTRPPERCPGRGFAPRGTPGVFDGSGGLGNPPLSHSLRACHAVGALLLLHAVVFPALAWAHDGGFGHSRRAICLTVEADRVVLEYRITQSRDEALVEMAAIDRDRDGRISTEEKDRYFAGRARRLAERLQAQTAEGELLRPAFVRYELQHGLVQVYRFTLPAPAGAWVLEDGNFPHKPGVVKVRTGPGLRAELASPADLTHADRVRLKIVRTAP